MADMSESSEADPPAPIDDLAPLGNEARRALEALLMVAEHPIDSDLLGQVVERSSQQVEDLLSGLAASYEEDGRGFELVRVAGGWRFQSHRDLAPYVERFVLSGQTARLSAAALETLSIVAYKQPISRAQVSAIRGVNVDGVMRTLQQRGYISEVGRDPGPGQPSMFGTTGLFLEKLGLDRLEDLPSLGDFIPGPEVVEALEHGLRADTDNSTGSDTATEAGTDTATRGECEGEGDEGVDSEPQVLDITGVTGVTDISDVLDITGVIDVTDSADSSRSGAADADHLPPG